MASEWPPKQRDLLLDLEKRLVDVHDGRPKSAAHRSAATNADGLRRALEAGQGNIEGHGVTP